MGREDKNIGIVQSFLSAMPAVPKNTLKGLSYWKLNLLEFSMAAVAG
jgi:hypothetical protein